LRYEKIIFSALAFMSAVLMLSFVVTATAETTAAATDGSEHTTAAEAEETEDVDVGFDGMLVIPFDQTIKLKYSDTELSELLSKTFSRNNIMLAGVGEFIHKNLFETAEPYKTPEQQDWEARDAAVSSYTDFGLSANVGTYINVRKNPSMDGEIIGKLLKNCAVDILDKTQDGKWFKIESGSVTGYVSVDYIITGEEAIQKGKEAANLQIVINTETLNVRSLPSEDSIIWTQADGGERYDVVEDMGDWIKIELDTTTGYVSSEFCKVTYSLDTAVKFSEPKQASLRSRIVNYAMKFLGTRYVWGGESLTKGVDCSGFTMKVYEHFGYNLSHYTGSQAYEGKKISRSELRAGDLVFYAKHGTIDHVMLYIGDGMVMGARSARRGVCIADLYYRTPVRYVRIIKN